MTGPLMAVQAAPAAPPAAPAVAPATAPGVPLEVSIAGVGPRSVVTIHFEGATAAGWVKAGPGSLAAVSGVKFSGGDLTFVPLAGSGMPPRVTFTTGITISGPVSGRAEVGKPASVTLKTPYGSTTTRGGPFELTVPSLPPTCTLGPCYSFKPGGKPVRCDDRPGAACYLYDSQAMCCTVCPTGC